MRLVVFSLMAFSLLACGPKPSASPGTASASSAGGAVPPSAPSPVLGKQVVMDLPSDGGALVSIGGGGEPLVVDFWAPSCVPCAKKLPELVAREGALRASGARLILVGVLADGESTEMARETLASWGVQRPFLVDREDVSRRAAGVSDLPATLVLNAQHVATWAASPTSSADDVVAAAAAVR